MVGTYISALLSYIQCTAKNGRFVLICTRKPRGRYKLCRHEIRPLPKIWNPGGCVGAGKAHMINELDMTRSNETQKSNIESGRNPDTNSDLTQ